LKVVPISGGKMIVGTVGQPYLLNPVVTQANEADAELESLIYSSLFTFNDQGDLVPSLAQKYDVSEDGKTYTVILGKNILWQDGTDFSADDVIFTIEAIQDPDYHSPWRNNWLGVVAEKVNQGVVQFHLNKPYVGFKDNLTVKIIPSHIWSQINVKNLSFTKYSLQPIGTGPYIFSELTKDALGNIISYSLKANEYYFEKLPNISAITYRFYKNYDELKVAFQKKEISSLSNIPNSFKETVKNRSNYFETIELPRYYAVFYNLKSNNSLLSDTNNRLALNLAIDRETIKEKAFGGNLLETNNLISQGFLGYNPTPTAILSYSPDKSRELLGETYHLNDSSNWEKVIKQKKGADTYQPLKLTLTVVDLPELITAAEIIKTNWNQIGIPTDIKTVSLTELETDTIPNKNYEALLFGEFYGREPDPYNFWHSGGSLNLSGFSNKTADALLEEIQQLSDSAKRESNLIELQNILLGASACYSLGNPLQLYALAPNVSGNTLREGSYLSDRYNNIANWYIRTRLSR
jgi:peptide/nickel transport system substrate-binding protein